MQADSPGVKVELWAKAVDVWLSEAAAAVDGLLFRVFGLQLGSQSGKELLRDFFIFVPDL